MNLIELEANLLSCSERSKLFQVVKGVMKARGRWKNKPRGDSSKGFALGMGKDKRVS